MLNNDDLRTLRHIVTGIHLLSLTVASNLWLHLIVASKLLLGLTIAINLLLGLTIATVILLLSETTHSYINSLILLGLYKTSHVLSLTVTHCFKFELLDNMY